MSDVEMACSYDLVVLGGGIVGCWTAARAGATGLRVCLVEAGPFLRTDQRDPQPSIQFTERENLGATRARNHVLGGNAAYWGGGLIRNPDQSLAKMFESSSGDIGMSHSDYDRVESILGINRRTIPTQRPIAGNLELDEILVLPGRRRNLAADLARAIADRRTSIECLTNAEIMNVERSGSGQVVSVTVVSDGRQHTVSAPWFVVSMGVIDSNLFVQRFFLNGFDSNRRAAVGSHLHDHWSILVAKVVWRNGTPASNLFPPKFEPGGVSGRRLRFEDGFFHLQVDYDSMPPYDRVKTLLSSLQKREGTWVTMGRALSTLWHPLLMARAGVHFLKERELFVPDGQEVGLTLDFESDADPRNRVWQDGSDAFLDWDVRDKDVSRFLAILDEHAVSLGEFFEGNGLAVEWQIPLRNQRAAGACLRDRAIDAYHLGGGLQALPHLGIRTTDSAGRLFGCPNMFINSTAAFARPGPANPVLTLLARATSFVDRVAKMAGKAS